GRWCVCGGRWSVVGGRWSVVGGQWPVVSGWWAVVGGQWSDGPLRVRAPSQVRTCLNRPRQSIHPVRAAIRGRPGSIGRAVIFKSSRLGRGAHSGPSKEGARLDSEASWVSRVAVCDATVAHGG